MENGLIFLPLGFPLCVRSQVMAFILDSEITVVLFLKMHVRVLGK